MDNINSTTRSLFREREESLDFLSHGSKDSFGTISKFIVIRGQSFHLDTIILYFSAVNQLNLLS